MIAIYLLPVFLIGHSIIIYWFVRWLKNWHQVFQKKIIISVILIFYTYFIIDMYVSAFIPPGKVAHICKLIGNYWLGITMYAVMLIVLALIVRFILKHTPFKDAWWMHDRRVFALNGVVYIALIVVIIVGGHINAKKIYVKDYQVHIDKSGGKLFELNIVLVADLHMGHNIQSDMIEQMTEKVNLCNADIVLIAGDIFDNDYDSLSNPDELKSILKGIRSKYGTYAVYGNHDVDELIITGFTFPSSQKKVSDVRMDDFLKDCGIKLLRDDYILLEDSVYIFGRPDEERPGRDIEERLTPEEIVNILDKDKPIIVLEHEPKHLTNVAEAGVDLHLAGHTHDGQFFPMNLTDRIVFDNCCGQKEFDQLTSIVTAGVGLYGPYIRVCTQADICNIHVSFDK